jgi:hypothetical protein
VVVYSSCILDASFREHCLFAEHARPPRNSSWKNCSGCSNAQHLSTQCLKYCLAHPADFGTITTLALVPRTGQSPKRALGTCIGTEGNLSIDQSPGVIPVDRATRRNSLASPPIGYAWPTKQGARPKKEKPTRQELQESSLPDCCALLASGGQAMEFVVDSQLTSGVAPCQSPNNKDRQSSHLSPRLCVLTVASPCGLRPLKLTTNTANLQHVLFVCSCGPATTCSRSTSGSEP